jgi:hypothetical protein
VAGEFDIPYEEMATQFLNYSKRLSSPDISIEVDYDVLENFYPKDSRNVSPRVDMFETNLSPRSIYSPSKFVFSLSAFFQTSCAPSDDRSKMTLQDVQLKYIMFLHTHKTIRNNGLRDESPYLTERLLSDNWSNKKKLLSLMRSEERRIQTGIATCKVTYKDFSTCIRPYSLEEARKVVMDKNALKSAGAPIFDKKGRWVEEGSN